MDTLESINARHIDKTITATVIHPAVVEYREEGNEDSDWWHSVDAPGYPHGVDVNIYDGDDGDGVLALVYPNVEYTDERGEKVLETDTDRLLAVIPATEWL